MRTFTLEGTDVVPGLKARQLPSGRWVVDGISLNPDSMPEIQDGRVVRASFSKPHYPDARKPHGVDSATWYQWLRETPSMKKSCNPEYTLRAEKSPNDTAVLVRIEGGFYTMPGELIDGNHPVAHRCVNGATNRVVIAFVRMTPGMRIMLGDGRQCLAYKHGATSPKYYTWRQWELERAEELTNPMAVTCVTLKQTRLIDGWVSQQCQPGIAVTPDTSLGSAIVIGELDKSPELLPLFDGDCEEVIHSATVGTVAERVLYEPEYSGNGQNAKSQSIPLYGFKPTAEVDGSTVMVLVEGVAFHNNRVMRGNPTTIMHQNDERYDDTRGMVLGACIFLMKEGEAISYHTRKDPLITDPEYVLDVRDGQLRITPHKEWRVADMNERPERYLDPAYMFNPQATPQNIPSSWVGRQVSLGGETYGELLCVDGDAVMIRTDWSHAYGNLPKVIRRTPPWVTLTGDRFEERPVNYKKERFLRWRVPHAVFSSTTSSTSLTTMHAQYFVRSVVIADLGTSKTGEVTCMFGAPLFKEGSCNYPWEVQTKWCETYQEAEQLRATFMEQLGNSTEKAEALQRRLEFEQQYSDRLLR